MKNLYWLTPICVSALVLTIGATANWQEPDDLRHLSDNPMRAKLEYAQKVLEGLALADFEMVQRGAGRLVLFNLESEWEPLKSAEYLRQGSEFRRTAEELRKAAEEENIDWATLAYVEMTMKCVQCHKHIRDVMRP